MCVTVLPKSDAKYVCRPKEDHITFVMILKRVLTIASGGGLSINGHHVYCGDYIFSGHTLTLVMAYLVIRQCKYKNCLLIIHKPILKTRLQNSNSSTSFPLS